MKTVVIFAVLLFSVSATAAQDKTFLQKIAGNWEGTLEYLDYQDNKRVTLKTYLTVITSEDGNSAEFKTVYDDVTHFVKEAETVKMDLAAKKYLVENSVYQIASITNGKIVLLGSGEDGENIEPIRKTITVDENSLSFLKETRTPWQFRNQMILHRGQAGFSAERAFTFAQMKADLDLLEKALTTLHPGIYRYQTPESIKKIFVAAEIQLRIIHSEREFFVLLAQVTSRIKCGHTYLNPDNQKEEIQNRLLNQKTFLPFYFRLIGGKMIVTGNVSPKELSPGSEIVKINGIRVAEIIKRLLTITTADGNNNLANRLNQLEVDSFRGSHYAAFDVYFPLFFQLRDNVFTIEAVNSGENKPRQFQVPAMTKAERLAATVKHDGKVPDYDDAWQFEISSNKTAYLKIANSETWELKKVVWKEFLAAAFAQMRQRTIKNLIIDLRDNDGGDTTLGFELARYLAREQLPIYLDGKRLVRNVAPQPELLKFITAYNKKLKVILQNGFPAETYRKVGNDYFEILPSKDFEGFPPVAPAENNFQGKTVVICDSSSASATFTFLNYVQKNKLATIVGQPTGGNKQGINGGSYYFLSLPNSGFEIDIPIFYTPPRSSEKDGGVVPDIIVKPRVEDVANGLDKDLKLARGLIEVIDR